MELKKTGTNASIVVDRTDGATNYINATTTSGNFGTVTNHVLRLVVGSEWKMRLHTDNSLTMRNGASCSVGGTWTNASSRDLKENIRGLDRTRPWQLSRTSLPSSTITRRTKRKITLASLLKMCRNWWPPKTVRG